MTAPRRTLFVLVAVLACLPPARAADPPLRRIAFGSCAQQNRPLPIWEAVVAAKPDVFLFIGDVVYADTKDMDVMRKTYQKLADNPGYQKLLKTCPVLATWDDHDYGGNDAGADYPKKKESQQIFLDFLGEPKDSPRRRQEGVHDARVFGPPGRRVQVILLDTRYHRSPLKKKAISIPSEGPYLPTTEPSATFLGEAQWKWLGEQLKAPAEVRIIASSIQVVAEDHGHEKWMNIPHERERLFKVLCETKAAGVLLLSGDRHLAELSVTDAGLGYPLYDLTSSGLNQASKSWRKLETNRHRVATMNRGDNFGLIDIDWDRKDPRLCLQIRDDEGDISIQEKIDLSLLRPGALTVKLAPPPKLDTGEPLTAAEVTKRLGQKVTVEFAVRSTGASGSRGFLNSADDHRSEGNFTVVLEKAALEGFKKDGVASPQEHFKGKTIRVTGTLSLYRERPQIVVEDARQVRVVE
jgi:alkaline phosphatase D